MTKHATDGNMRSFSKGSIAVPKKVVLIVAASDVNAISIDIVRKGNIDYNDGKAYDQNSQGSYYDLWFGMIDTIIIFDYK